MNNLQSWYHVLLVLLTYRPGLIVGRSLEDICERAQVLSGKGRLARFVDKSRDSSEITKLSEDLQQAILIYQVGVLINCQRELGGLNVFLGSYLNNSPSKTKPHS